MLTIILSSWVLGWRGCLWLVEFENSIIDCYSAALSLVLHSRLFITSSHVTLSVALAFSLPSGDKKDQGITHCTKTLLTAKNSVRGAHIRKWKLKAISKRRPYRATIRPRSPESARPPEQNIRQNDDDNLRLSPPYREPSSVSAAIQRPSPLHMELILQWPLHGRSLHRQIQYI